MAESLTRSVLATSVAGVLIAGVSYYFFTLRPVDPSDGIKISYREQSVPVGFFAPLIGEINPPASGTGASVVDKFQEFFGFYENATIGTFKIENGSGKQIQNLTYNLTDHISGYVADDNGKRAIEADAKTATITLLPDGVASISLLMNYSRFGVPGKFTIQGEAVDVREVESRLSEPSSAFAADYPFTAFMLMMIGGLALAGLALVAIFALVSIRTPYALAGMTTAETLGQHLALLNFTRIENP